jgi:putative ABC transport system substrate-binding protein
MIRRRALCQWLAGSGVVLANAGAAQSTDKVYRIGELDIGREDNLPAPRLPPPPDFFTPELARLGLIRGVNLVIDTRTANGNPALLDAVAAELVASRPDVLFTAAGFVATRALKNATTTIPIVFAAVGEPVAAGLVASLARPGGNLTGGALPDELDLKRLEILIEVLGASASIAMLTGPIVEGRMNRIRKQLADRNLHVRFPEVKRSEDLAPAFEQMARQRIDGLVIALSPFTGSHTPEIGELVAKHRLPAIADPMSSLDFGVMISYSVDWQEVERKAARTVYKVLMGARPAELPIEQVEKFDFAINLKVARALGVRIPTSVRIRATQVIE